MATLLLVGCGRSSPALHPVGVGANYFPASSRVAAHALAGKAIDGASLDLAPGNNHMTVVNVWGSWCAPCREEAATLAAAARKLAPAEVRFVGIDVEDTRPGATAFERRYKIPYPSFFNPTGSFRYRFRYPAFATPVTYVIDGQGEIAAVVYGRTRERQLIALVRRAEP
jgi:thiol-disulfide isomerase/thioredoxin